MNEILTKDNFKVSLSVKDLSPEDLEAISISKMSSKFDYLNYEVEPENNILTKDQVTLMTLPDGRTIWAIR